MSVFIIIGIGFFIVGSLKDDTRYAILKKEPLIFDSNFIKSLAKEYSLLRKKYNVLLTISILLIAIGVIPIFVTVKGYGIGEHLNEYHGISFLILAVGFFGFVITVSYLEAYELLLFNDEYSNRFFIKLTRKLKDRFDKF